VSKTRRRILWQYFRAHKIFRVLSGQLAMIIRRILLPFRIVSAQQVAVLLISKTATFHPQKGVIIMATSKEFPELGENRFNCFFQLGERRSASKTHKI